MGNRQMITQFQRQNIVSYLLCCLTAQLSPVCLGYLLLVVFLGFFLVTVLLS